MSEWKGFDPDFDDTQWTDGWLHVPIALIPPGQHSSGYRVERRMLQHVEVFGRPMTLTAPLECRVLFDPQGQIWMSDTPQERIMMYNNGLRSQGSVLVGGLGLGLYLQYGAVGAAGQATHFTVIEQSPVVVEITEPTLSVSLGVPLDVFVGDVAAHLSGPITERYDTIFLDTWGTLDAAFLPAVNRLRESALRHLTPDGQVLLWGYRWMVRLFEDACRRLFAVAPGGRHDWLRAQRTTSAQAVALLEPVVRHFGERPIVGLDEALAWCRQYIMRRVTPVQIPTERTSNF
jgi:hypothetical protein